MAGKWGTTVGELGETKRKRYGRNYDHRCKGVEGPCDKSG